MHLKCKYEKIKAWIHNNNSVLKPGQSKSLHPPHYVMTLLPFLVLEKGPHHIPQ